ncbi:hypothetical protein DM02DRAFT_163364 [Periconia macrospinosa]|uniref:Uncharacterized protein n=1 Tax=Periconia macrospinosa TaxID=97972 RepID=A0A2V1DB31_9PLEO|nr:hypothetical protein DM02DRAFT_163364 [Periconia macrospinosa]
MATSKPLPPELLAQVFSHLTPLLSLSYSQRCQNITTLLNACLASRKLYDIAQPHLYEAIEFDISSLQLKHLLPVLRTKPHLISNTKALSITQSGSDYYGMQLRQFTQEFLPVLTKLDTFRSDCHVGTSHLIHNMLFKVGSSYTMAEPTDFGQVTRLELYAGKMVFQYNYLLRLPRLETVCLNGLDIYDPYREDSSLSRDWKWTSSTIKNLVLRPFRGPKGGWGPNLVLDRENSLTALAHSMPNLESLTIDQSGEHLNPSSLFRLLSFFDEQLRGSLRRLELKDGKATQETLRPPYIESLYDRDEAMFAGIRESSVEELLIDSHVFLHVEREVPLLDPACIPKSVRSLDIRHRDTPFGNPAMDMWELRDQDVVDLVTGIKNARPCLESIFLEVIARTKIENSILDTYRAAFRDVGIRFCIVGNVVQQPREETTGTIVCSTRPSVEGEIIYDGQ